MNAWLAVVWLFSARLPAQPAAIVSSATAAQLGQPVAVRLRATAGPALAPDLEKSATDFFQITKAAPAANEPGAWDLELVPLALGRLRIPIYWKAQKDGRTQEAKTELSLDVAAPPTPGDDIADIKAPRAARPALWPWLLAAAAGALAYWLWTRLKREGDAAQETAAAVDDRPAEVIAEEELAALAESSLWPEQRYKEFYMRLTDALRRYLERRYGMAATKLTTAELQRMMRHAELDRAVILSFRAVFERADLVKFSKVEPEESWGERDLAAARELVRKTTPVAAQQPQEARP